MIYNLQDSWSGLLVSAAMRDVARVGGDPSGARCAQAAGGGAHSPGCAVSGTACTLAEPRTRGPRRSGTWFMVLEPIMPG